MFYRTRKSLLLWLDGFSLSDIGIGYSFAQGWLACYSHRRCYTNKIKLVYNNATAGQYCVACTTEFDPSGDGVFWKVKLEKIPRNWIFLGIAETLDLQNDIYADNKTYGWIEHATYVKGRRTGHSRTDGISDFNQGESLYFSLKSNKLQIGPLLAIVIVIIFVVVSLFSMVFFMVQIMAASFHNSFH